MIGRFWRGWATAEHATAYANLFRTSILPDLQSIDGFIGAYVLCRDTDGRSADGAQGEVEIMTCTLFASLDAVRAFAGDDPTRAHLTPEARQLLAHFEPTVTHYEVLVAP